MQRFVPCVTADPDCSCADVDTVGGVNMADVAAFVNGLLTGVTLTDVSVFVADLIASASCPL